MSEVGRRPSWRELLERDRPLVLPGAYDALSAVLIERAGFDAMVIGGFGLVGARYGLPDIGLVGLGEMAAGVRDILGATRLPVLVDADHGYGDVKNVVHTVQTYERMGVAALLIEDQVAPKRCGHLGGKSVVPAAEMVARLKAAAAARSSADLFLIARTDARAVHGLDEALRRGEAYLAAGADGLFVEAPESVTELERIARAFDVPQMCNMLVGGRTPLLSNQALFDMGFQIIVHGTTLISAVVNTLLELLPALRSEGAQRATASTMPLAAFVELFGASRWTEIEERYAR